MTRLPVGTDAPPGATGEYGRPYPPVTGRRRGRGRLGAGLGAGVAAL
jgi:hypothetical protein